MLDIIRARVDDAWNEKLARRQFNLFEDRPFVLVAGIGGLE